VTSIGGGARVPEDSGKTEGKGEPAAAEGVEGQRAPDDPQVCSESGVTTDQRGAGGTREPGGATRPRVSGGADGGRSQDGADRSMGQDGVK